MYVLSWLCLLFTFLPSNIAIRIYPAPHKARSFEAENLTDAKSALLDIREDLRYNRDNLEILQSSFDSETLSLPIQPNKNGLVFSLIEAYASHRHLILRPEDIWFAVLTQLSIYINAHGEDLRSKFVAHEDQKALTIFYDVSSRHQVNMAEFAQSMTHLIHKNVVDPDLRTWIMPNFSTTTHTDTTVASILMMTSMQKYFTYSMGIICGIPSVTLLGEKADYENILARLDKLASWGAEPARFAELLRPVLRRFILSFDEPTSKAVLDFWARIFDDNSEICGMTLYSGWITAFYAWDEEGEFLADQLHGEDKWYGNDRSWNHTGNWDDAGTRHLYLSLDGVKYPAVDAQSIPPGWGKVPVTIYDEGREIQAEMVAGSVGKRSLSSGEEDEGGVVGLDSIQPHVGWWIWEKSPTWRDSSPTREEDLWYYGYVGDDRENEDYDDDDEYDENAWRFRDYMPRDEL